MNDIKKDRRYQNIRIGDRVDFTRCFSMESFQEFSRLSRDSNPLHHDMTYVMATSFQQPIQPLHLTSIPLSAIAGMMLPGHRSYYLGCQMRALYPASYHVDITYSSKVVAKNDHLQTITLRTIAFQGVRIILDAEQIIQVRDDIASEMAPHHDMDITIKSVSLDRTALITGASGAIGSAMALRLASHGFNLILTSRSRDAEFEGHVLQRCQEYGVEVEWITVDLESEANELSPLVSRLGAGSVVTDLVHVASPRVHATANELLNVNYTAMKTLTEAFLPQVLRRQEGRVLFTGSSAVQQAPLGWEDYSAAKAAASQYITAMNNH
ncbi:MAG TPA: SDR family NAD(P)-dependent oxidoreductase, partial [Magnetococcales bacterium]|nr:SDR family NAD(P)-dependent oxidoreductase [Magnetococcales bacterium]